MGGSTHGSMGYIPSPSPLKERETKGVRLINNPSPYQGEGDTGDIKRDDASL